MKEEIYALEALVKKLERKVAKLKHENRMSHSKGYQAGHRDGIKRSLAFIHQYETAKKSSK